MSLLISLLKKNSLISFLNFFTTIFFVFFAFFNFSYSSFADDLNSENNSFKHKSNVSNNSDMNTQQIYLLKQIQSTLTNIKENNKNKWDKYSNMEKDILYPEKPYPGWQSIVSDDGGEFDFHFDSKKYSYFLDMITRNSYLKETLKEANKFYVPSDMSLILNLGLNKSIANSSELQIQRLSAALLLKNYKSQVRQDRDITKLTNLISLLIVNNYNAQKKQSRQLDKLISILNKTNN